MRALFLVALTACPQSEFGLGVVLDVHPDEVTECEFTPVEGFEALQAYTCNPVFTTTGEPWAAESGHLTFLHTDVMGHPFYQLWFTGRTSGGETQIGMAVSADGTEWEPHPSNPGWPGTSQQAWDGGTIQQIKVAYDPQERAYRMLYGAFTTDFQLGGIGLASSRDGVSWERFPANPVLTLTLPRDGIDVAWPVTYNIRNGEHRALFAASRAVEDRLDLFQMATPDPERWDFGTPALALRAGADGSWDDQGFIDAALVEIGDVWWLFYVGFGSWIEDPERNVRTSQESFLGLARSDDGGDTWDRVGNTPLPINQTSEGQVNSVAARVIGPRAHVWVGDRYPDEDSNAVGYFLFEPTP